MNTYTWSDVEGVAIQAFSIWVDQPELRWAEKAWGMIVDAGLANYDSELGRCQGALRFMALASIYHDFCEHAFQHSSAACFFYQEWATELELHSFRIGQLVGRHAEWDTNADDAYTCADDALRYLVNNERRNVLRALLVGFDDDSLDNPARLFISLWRSNQSPKERDEDDPDDEDEPEFETDEDILGRPTPDKMTAWEWLTQGCP